MAKNALDDYSTTAASNTDIDGLDSTGATGLVKSGDNYTRSMMSHAKAKLLDLGASNTVGGTGDAITVTLASNTTALYDGMRISINAPGTNTGASVITVTNSGAVAIGTNKKIRKWVGGVETALSAGDITSAHILNLVYDSARDTGSGAFMLDGAASAPADDTAWQNTDTPINLSIVTSVGSNALTIAIKGHDGNDPSASNKVYVPFRNVTASSGDMDVLTLTAATSLVISSGSTMGFASGVMGRLWIVGFNDGGTFRLGAINVRNGLSIMALSAFGIASSTAEGGAGAADSPHVFYTGSAVTSKAYTILGYLDATEATAGTWATAPSSVVPMTAGSRLPGDIVARWTSIDGTAATGSTTTPLDNTIPQNTEGNQFMSLAVTLSSLANLVKVTHRAVYTTASVAYVICAIHENGVADAKGAGVSNDSAANFPYTVCVDFVGLAATTTPTYTLRAGGSAASTVRFNGYNGAQVFGGAANGILEVWEIMS